MPTHIHGLIDAALGILVEARRRADEVTTMPEANGLNRDDRRRLEVAITATHTVLEPPSLPTDELRAMGLWFDGEPVAGQASVGEPMVLLSREEARALNAYVNGDSFDVEQIDSFMAKVGESP